MQTPSHPGLLALAGLACVAILVAGFGRMAAGVRPIERTSAEAYLYDPASATWSRTGDMTQARAGHTAVLLKGGLVGVTGGVTRRHDEAMSRPEIWNPATGAWRSGAFQASETGVSWGAAPRELAPECPHGTVRVARWDDGRAAVVAHDHVHMKTPGGSWGPRIAHENVHDHDVLAALPDGALLRTSWRYDARCATLFAVLSPGADRWTSLSEWQDPARTYDASHHVVTLSDGRVLVVRGAFGKPFETLLIDPKTGRCEPGGSFAVREYPQYMRFAPLADGGVAMLGEQNFLRWGPRDRAWAAQPPPAPADGRSLTRLTDGRLLVAGGFHQVTPMSVTSAKYGVPLCGALLLLAALRTLVSWRACSRGARALPTLARVFFATGAVGALVYGTFWLNSITLPGVTSIPVALILGDGAIQLHRPALQVLGFAGLAMLAFARGDAPWYRGVAVLTWTLAFTLAIGAAIGSASLFAGVLGYTLSSVVILLGPLLIAPLVARFLAPDTARCGAWKAALAVAVVLAFTTRFFVSFGAILDGWLML